MDPLLIFNIFRVKNLKIENSKNSKIYHGLIDNYFRDLFLENISIEENNEGIKNIFINFTHEEKKPVTATKNTKAARIISRLTTPKNIKFHQSEIIFYFIDFKITIFYDVKSSASTLILQYKN